MWRTERMEVWMEETALRRSKVVSRTAGRGRMETEGRVEEEQE